MHAQVCSVDVRIFIGKNIGVVFSGTIFTCFSLQDFTWPYNDACLIEIVDDHWLGGLMSVNDFVSLFGGTTFGARLARGTLASTLATFIVCATVSDGNAATNGSLAFTATPFLSPAWPARADDVSPASFDARFDCRQNSLIRDFLTSPASRVLLPSLINRIRLEPLTTASLPQRRLTTASLPRIREHRKITPAAPAIVGIASMYNPGDPNDMDAGNEELASGERYDPHGWTAAIQTRLRAKFGGVRFGRNYQPAYALVEASDKQLIVKINDVGPLRRGRIIDLNQRAMRYFDPTLQLGLIGDVRVTPLAGQDWALGPVEDDQPVAVASRSDR